MAIVLRENVLFCCGMKRSVQLSAESIMNDHDNESRLNCLLVMRRFKKTHQHIIHVAVHIERL